MKTTIIGWMLLTAAALLLAGFGMLNAQVSLKYEFEEAVAMGYEHPANVDWLMSQITILKVSIGYLFLNLILLAWVLIKQYKNRRVSANAGEAI